MANRPKKLPKALQKLSKPRADHIPGLLIAAPASNSGKTVVTLGILRALANRNIAIAAAKAGPDYIDPAFQHAASRRRCINLDPWAMTQDAIRDLARWHVGASADGRFVLCEGVMGLFDGAAGGGGSSADLAAMMDWPVVLVVDVRGQAASAAAIIQGFANFRPDVQIAGVILNRVGSPRHRDMIMDACARAVPDIPIIGAVMRSNDLALPERHLGLVQAGEHPELEVFLERAGAIMARDIDFDALLGLVRTQGIDHGRVAGAVGTNGNDGTNDTDGDDGRDHLPEAGSQVQDQAVAPKDNGAAVPGDVARSAQNDAKYAAPVTIAPLGQHIAVARDDAFAFCYPHLIAGWQAVGVKISFFSPLANEAPPQGCDAVYLPGGYPELHGAVLAAADCFLDGLHDAARRNLPVYGECGGYMVLGDCLVDGDGISHKMAGLLPLETSFHQRRLHLGYRLVDIRQQCPLGNVGAVLRGHEFHYASTIRADGEGWLNARTADNRDLGPCGLQKGSVFGSFFHLIC
ncbi:cobyrinate a,c-diamide synthase [Thalassospira marina]|uniref:Cobyrinate a,c-diamide synthase n=1 Tax=Thalassospira marina TaxID=2048283 RepID=A0ABM6QE45_9PROT|nr:cobyrinate a,c-diamide synthase [Thalassospira marina]